MELKEAGRRIQARELVDDEHVKNAGVWPERGARNLKEALVMSVYRSGERKVAGVDETYVSSEVLTRYARCC